MSKVLTVFLVLSFLVIQCKTPESELSEDSFLYPSKENRLMGKRIFIS